MKVRQIFIEDAKDKCFYALLQTNLAMLFSAEKIFIVHVKVNQRNDRRISNNKIWK